ncbi:MAG TPA: GNAT family N-acetyltransferase [Marmoricola sp.]|jgi:GNAT superfamily N-acetyltransferase|nr:GNAT family N-acetyltransferase [Marmoricola sp.]
MSDPQITVDPAADADRYLATDHTVWFAEVPAASTETQLIGLAKDQRFAADIAGESGTTDPGTYPGVYGVYPMTLPVPGPGGPHLLPCAGLTWVGVHPDHRRQGVLTAMLRDHFERVRGTEGTHLSALHASEPAIYGRFGYGMASLEHEITLGHGSTLRAPHLDDAARSVRTQLVTVTDADVPERLRECHLAAAEPGSIIGDVAYYDSVCLQLPEWLRDKEPYRVLFARRDGVDVGWALFRRKPKWDNARPAGELEVWAMVGDPAARLALLRRLLDFDLMGTVKVGTVGVDDPILHWAGGPRATSDVSTYDSLWVRLVDLPAALAARWWSAPVDVVVAVADRHAPWNDGSWRIRVDDEGLAEVTPSRDDADLRLGVEALGAAYLGAGNLVALRRAGLVDERRPGAAAELWRGLRTDVAPTAAVGF